MTTSVHTFPVAIDESVFIAWTGPTITKAVIEARGTILSIKTPTMTDEITDIDFFGGKPFHAKLAKNWNATVKLTVIGDAVPSLVFKPATTTLTWEDYPNGIYIDPVTVGSDLGDKNLLFVYTPSYGGFKQLN